MSEISRPITSKSAIIPFPDFQKLKDDVAKLRTELSMLLLERDELQYVICKNIEMEYMLKLGSLEYRVYEAECAVLRLKRKINLLQIKKNRQEKIVISAIEEILDLEFAEYQRKLDEEIEKMNQALERSKCRPLNDEETKELKKLYRKVVKALHPDMNPEVTEAQARLFAHAIEAYENGDLSSLRMICEMVGDNSSDEQDTASRLSAEAERLRKQLETVRNDIERIKSEYPYTMRDILADSEKTERRKQVLTDILERYKEMAAVYNARIEEMLR